MKMDIGSNSIKSQTLRIKVLKIKAVKQLSKSDDKENVAYSDEDVYWYNPEGSNGMFRMAVTKKEDAKQY